MNDKTLLRKKICQQRKELSITQQNYAARQFYQQVSQYSVFQTAKHISIYHPIAGEMSPILLREYTSHIKQKYYLPVLSTGNTLKFLPWNKKTIFKSNIYGIPEPHCEKNTDILAKQLDLIVLPLVAFDLSGNRLGMGGGYYDRTLAFTSNSTNKKPFLLGCAYEFQKSTILKKETWDIPLDAIATEKQIYFNIDQ